MEAAQTDAALALSVLAGDAHAPGVTWNRYVRLVRQIAGRWLGSGPEVEDVTQEVFFRLFNRFATLRNPAALPGFVAGFAIRVARSEHRRRRAASWLVLTDTGQVDEDDWFVAPPDSRFELSQLYKKLGTMPARERRVLLLRHLEGMTLEEVAEASQLSLATVKRILRRASSRIRGAD